MKDFLKQYIKTKDGDVLNEQGEVVGSHDGAVLYTIGERHGFNIFEKNLFWEGVA
jgi:tRNA-specific 2-thiouridylase